MNTLGFEEENLQYSENGFCRPYGIIIVSGPTGSGKSTTLHAAVKPIQDIETNIITVEDPVEYRLEVLLKLRLMKNWTYIRCSIAFRSSSRSRRVAHW